MQQLETLKGLQSLWIYSSTNFSSAAKDGLRKNLPNLYHFTAEQDRAIGVVTSSSHPTPGTLAPDFNVTTLDGAKFKLSEQRGKVVMLHYWGTWCAPCIVGFPELKKVQTRLKEKYGDRVVFLGLAMDDNESKLRDVVETLKLNTPQTRIGMQSKIAESYGVIGAPDDFMIGPDGRILLNQKSPEDPGDTEAVIDKALGLVKAR